MVAPATNGSAYATVTTTLATAVFPSSHIATQGNLLVAAHFSRSNSTESESSLEWTRAFTQLDNNNRRMSLWLRQSQGDESGVAISLSVAARHSLFVWEMDGADTAAIMADPSILGCAFTTSTGTNVSSLLSASVNPVTTDDAWFCYVTGLNNTDGGSRATNNSFTLGLADNVSCAFTSQRNITNPGATTVTHSWTTARQASGMLFAVPAAPSGSLTSKTIGRTVAGTLTTT